MGKLYQGSDYWSELDESEYEILSYDDETPEEVLLEAREMLHRLENKSSRRGKMERSLRKSQAWT